MARHAVITGFLARKRENAGADSFLTRALQSTEPLNSLFSLEYLKKNARMSGKKVSRMLLAVDRLCLETFTPNVMNYFCEKE